LEKKAIPRTPPRSSSPLKKKAREISPHGSHDAFVYSSSTISSARRAREEDEGRGEYQAKSSSYNEENGLSIRHSSFRFEGKYPDRSPTHHAKGRYGDIRDEKRKDDPRPSNTSGRESKEHLPSRSPHKRDRSERRAGVDAEEESRREERPIKSSHSEDKRDKNSNSQALKADELEDGEIGSPLEKIRKVETEQTKTDSRQDEKVAEEEKEEGEAEGTNKNIAADVERVEEEQSSEFKEGEGGEGGKERAREAGDVSAQQSTVGHMMSVPNTTAYHTDEGKSAIRSTHFGSNVVMSTSSGSASQSNGGVNWQTMPWPEEVEAERERRVRKRNRPPPVPLRERTFYGCSSIDQYNLGVKLGQGTFGEVKKASHFLTGVEVALKKVTIHEEKDGMPITAIREIKLLKKLSHPSIIAVIDMAYRGATERGRMGEVFMVEPYMDHDLNGMLENPSIQFTPSQIKLYMKQLFEGTLYMHQVSYNCQ